ncbi:hypothetical protein, partial [Pseudonocardia halophobica]|uniref:hypothetical protein n=1 Tax=Pseudonocardia halophobica TaxID=29401 RepID=UPI0031DF66A3
GGRPAGLLTEPQGLVLSGVSLTTRKLRPADGEGQTGVPHPETGSSPQVRDVRPTPPVGLTADFVVHDAGHTSSSRIVPTPTEER